MLFLMAAGLTLVFGIMNLVNLAHGSLYMVGAYFAAIFAARTGSFVLALLLALPATALVGIAVEVVVLRTLYRRDHLDQVLATFGLILFFNEGVRLIGGKAARYMALPHGLEGNVALLPGLRYPAYRLVVMAVGLAVAVFLYLLVTRTRMGMLIRAGARLDADLRPHGRRAGGPARGPLPRPDRLTCGDPSRPSSSPSASHCSWRCRCSPARSTSRST